MDFAKGVEVGEPVEGLNALLARIVGGRRKNASFLPTRMIWTSPRHKVKFALDNITKGSITHLSNEHRVYRGIVDGDLGRLAIPHVNARKLFLFEDPPHRPQRLNRDDLEPLISRCQRFGELSCACRKVEDSGLAFAIDLDVLEKCLDCICWIRCSMSVVLPALAETRLHLGVQVAGGRHRELHPCAESWCISEVAIAKKGRSAARSTTRRRNLQGLQKAEAGEENVFQARIYCMRSHGAARCGPPDAPLGPCPQLLLAQRSRVAWREAPAGPAGSPDSLESLPRERHSHEDFTCATRLVAGHRWRLTFPVARDREQERCDACAHVMAHQPE